MINKMKSKLNQEVERELTPEEIRAQDIWDNYERYSSEYTQSVFLNYLFDVLPRAIKKSEAGIKKGIVELTFTYGGQHRGLKNDVVGNFGYESVNYEEIVTSIEGEPTEVSKKQTKKKVKYNEVDQSIFDYFRMIPGIGSHIFKKGCSYTFNYNKEQILDFYSGLFQFSEIQDCNLEDISEKYTKGR